MALRTRRIAIDQDNTWRYRFQFVNEGDPIPPEQDYIVLTNDAATDDPSFGTLTIPVYYSTSQAYTGITVWGSGLVSFGAPTQEQIDFMATLSSQTDFSQFPGDYIATSILTNVSTIEVGMKDGFVVVTYDEGAAQIRIFPDRININGQVDHGGVHIGGNTVSVLGNGSFDIDLRRFESVYGDGNANTITGAAAPQTIYGYGGNDVLSSGAGAHIIYGGDGDDTITGGQYRDSLYGGTGTDLIRAGVSDFADGGGGTDTLMFDFQTQGGQLYLRLADAVGGSFNGVTFANFEMLGIIGGANNDVLIGTGAAQRLNGGGGYDLLSAGGGNDLLDGGFDAPPLQRYMTDGGSSIETAIPVGIQFSNSTSTAADDPLVPHVDLLIRSDRNFNSVTDDYFSFSANAGAELIVDIDGLSGIGTGTITLYDSFGNIIASDSGGDFFVGDGDGDPRLQITLAGGSYFLQITSFSDFFLEGDFSTAISLSSATVLTGNRMIGGTGDDQYVVRNAADQVVELADQGNDLVQAWVTHSLAANVERLTLAGTAAINGTGNLLNNVINGNSAANTLNGAGGNDTINGGLGNDSILGGEGNDSISGNEGADVIGGDAGNDRLFGDDGADTLYGSHGTDQLYGGTGDDTLNGNVGDDLLMGDAGNDTLLGSFDNDQLNGGQGNDSLDGGDGIDLLIGGTGRDTMIGRGGADTFRFDDGEFGGATTATADVIMDFTRAQGDRINLQLVDAIAGGTDNAFTFIGTAAFTGAAGQLRYELIGGNTYVMGTTNADTTADFMIRLNGNLALIAADFVL